MGLSSSWASITCSLAQWYPAHTVHQGPHDIDVVVTIQPSEISKLAPYFPDSDYGFDEVAAVEAIARKDQFQLFEIKSGDKIDFWILHSNDFHQQTFARRVKREIVGIDVWCATAEDLIVQKLSWAQWYESERQFDDALEVYETQYRRLNIPHIEKWVATLGIDKIWQQLLRDAQPFT